MKLSEEDAALFYELMWALQFYLKQQLNLLPEIKTLQQYPAIHSNTLMLQ
ncbi:hypothetical protein [Leptodesmis sp.]